MVETLEGSEYPEASSSWTESGGVGGSQSSSPQGAVLSLMAFQTSSMGTSGTSSRSGSSGLKAAQISVSAGIEYAPEGGDPQYWWIPKLGHFRLDLLFFVGLYATRGTDISKIALRSTSEMSAIIMEKAKTYQIKGKKEKAKKGKRGRVPKVSEIGGDEKIAKEEITLARLASCVPHLVCDYYKAGVGRVLVVIPEPYAVAWKEFPMALKHNVLAAVWPNHDEIQWPREVTYLIAYLIDRRVNPDSGQDLSTIMLYQDIALSSDFFSKTMRIETMKAAGVPMEGENPTPTMGVVFREMRDYWKSLGVRQATGPAATPAPGMTTLYW